MKTTNFALRIAAIATLSIGAISGAFANNTIANVNSTNKTGNDFTFSGGVGGTLQTVPGGFPVSSTGAANITTPGTFVTITPLTESGQAFNLGGGSYVAPFSGGSFQIKQGSTVLLAGTFKNSVFFNTSGSSFTLSTFGDAVTYTDPTGLYATQYVTKYGATPVTGNFSWSFSSVASPGGGSSHSIHTVGSGSSTGIAAFTVKEFGGTFDADTSVVPEANGSLLMLAALAPLGIAGVLLRRKRAVSPVSAA